MAEKKFYLRSFSLFGIRVLLRSFFTPSPGSVRKGAAINKKFFRFFHRLTVRISWRRKSDWKGNDRFCWINNVSIIVFCLYLHGTVFRCAHFLIFFFSQSNHFTVIYSEGILWQLMIRYCSSNFVVDFMVVGGCWKWIYI